MRALAIEPRTEALRRSIAEKQLALDGAVETLSRVSGEQLSVGHHVAKHPWSWIAGGCAVGLLIGLGRPRQ